MRGNYAVQDANGLAKAKCVIKFKWGSQREKGRNCCLGKSATYICVEASPTCTQMPLLYYE